MEQAQSGISAASPWRLPDGELPVFDPPELEEEEAGPPAPPPHPELALISPHVDAAFYRASNPDVGAAGVAPAEHYWRTGWREGRDPSPWFRTEYYLRANPDVRAAGINPLWHYLARGREEGRTPREPGGPWRAEMERVLAEAGRPAARAVPEDAAVLDVAALRALLAAACAGASGLVLAFSHDRYTLVPGGTQLLIANEQRRFNGDLCAYLHLAPLHARLGLAPPGETPGETPDALAVTLDGTWRGVAAHADLAAALAELAQGLPRLLVVHTLHGLQPESVAALAAVLRPARALFWAHDYGAGCPDPRLLRNGVAFCGAPPPASLACRVCVHGEARAAHLARVEVLFRAMPFDLIAPSEIAAATWQRAAPLPVRRVIVHPHATLEAAPEDDPPDPAGPVRVAFVGQAVFAKGWGAFAELLREARGEAAYRFLHFASPGELQSMDGLHTVAATVGPAQPYAMLQALAAARIELVVLASPWPETFGYVAHEALAAGAFLVTLAASGHVADLARRSGRGVVLADEMALAAYVLSRRAAAEARARRALPRPRAALRHVGSSASLTAGAQTDDPGLFVVAGGARVDPAREGEWLIFRLPPRGRAERTVRLRSRWMAPAWEPDMPADPRHLGVAIAEMRIDDADVPAGDARRVAGWHPAENVWQWTDGDAVLRVGKARRLALRLLPLGRYPRAGIPA
jgi:glycosyltransferase involved in cell wall biosynthesis